MTTLQEQTPSGMGLDTELRGPRGVRHAITDFLRTYLPHHAAACRAVWGLDDHALPMPANVPDDNRRDGYVEHEPAAIDRWPLVAVTSGRRTQTTVDWTDDGQQQFRSVYPVRIYSWVKAEGWDATQDMRDDFASAVQVTVLAHPNLGQPASMQLMPASVVTDFSDVVAVKGERHVAGAYVGFDLAVIETLTDRLALPGQQPRGQAGPPAVGVEQGDPSTGNQLYLGDLTVGVEP